MMLEVVGADSAERGWSRRLSFGAVREVFEGQAREKERVQRRDRAAEVVCKELVIVQGNAGLRLF